MNSKLVAALGSVDWSGNAKLLCDEGDLCSRIENANLILAIWSKQLEQIEAGNPALSFVREMQHCGHHVASLLGLALYKPAAASMRALVECALYYSYFRSHPVELATLVRNPKYYLQRKDIVDFHELHTLDYSSRQACLNLNSGMSKWYSATSAIVHGQIPGAWSNGISVTDIVFDKTKVIVAIAHFEEAAQLVNDTFLCVVAQDIWRYMDHSAKLLITKGLSGAKKVALNLDKA